jgi:hypothetical protein
MSEPSQPYWLSWILPMLGVLGALWAFVKRVFTNAVRELMTSMHHENQVRLDGVANRISVVENTLARIEGRMQERWGDYQENDR